MSPIKIIRNIVAIIGVGFGTYLIFYFLIFGWVIFGYEVEEQKIKRKCKQEIEAEFKGIVIYWEESTYGDKLTLTILQEDSSTFEYVYWDDWTIAHLEKYLSEGKERVIKEKGEYKITLIDSIGQKVRFQTPSCDPWNFEELEKME